MNKTERLSGIILFLANRKRVTAKELADLFEVSIRTIYRDVQALSELQVPIVADKGVEGGYSLLDHYFVKPVMLTEDEVEAVYLGCDFLAGQEGFPLRRAATLALEKLSAVIPGELKNRGEEILQSISFNLLSHAAAETYADYLHQLKWAMDHRKTVEIDYQPLTATTTRKMDPYALICQNNAWYCNAYCHLRQEMRQFKLSRIRRLVVTDEEFTLQELDKANESAHLRNQASSHSSAKGVAIVDQVSGYRTTNEAMATDFVKNTQIRRNSTPTRLDGNNESTSQVTHQIQSILVKVSKGTKAHQQVIESNEYRGLIVQEDTDNVYLAFPHTGYQRPYLFQIVLGWKAQAEIIEPPLAREEFLALVEQMASLYKI